MANLSPHCYPQPAKEKAQRLCRAFARSCGGVVVDQLPAELLPGPAVFYGVRPMHLHLWKQAKAEGRDWYYIDNAYFDNGRESYFRVTRGALQARMSDAAPDYVRLADRELVFRPWQRNAGGHIVVAAQSDEFMATVCGWPTWLQDTVAELARYTKRSIVVRSKSTTRSLEEDLQGAHAMVTHMSAAANEALLDGIPVFVTGVCAARYMAAPGLEYIEHPRYPDNREEWAARYCAMQWTEKEIADGAAWRHWNRI